MRSALLTLAASVVVARLGLATTAPASAATVSIRADNFYFCDPSFHLQVCTTTVQQGDTVVWDFSGEVHSTTACGASCDAPAQAPLWDSGIVDPGTTFSFTFSTPGSYLYFCRVHPIDMRGQIVVQAAAPTAAPGQPAATPAAAGVATAAPQAGGTTGSLPVAGAGPQSGTLPWEPAVALVAIGGALLGAAAAARRSLR